MQKVFCLSIRPDGYGEGVVPEMEQPIFDYDFPPDGPSDAMLESAYDDFDLRVKRWYDHINSLPVLYLIHPDLHKGKVGFIGEHTERYEAFMYDGEWLIVEKWEYDNASPQYRRIVLVPVEGKEEEKEVVSWIKDYLQHDAEEFEPQVTAYHFSLSDMCQFANELLNQFAKPTPVTGEAVDYFSTWLKSEVATLSREVSMSKAMNGMFDKVHLQILHKRLTEVLDKYQLFKQQTTKP